MAEPAAPPTEDVRAALVKLKGQAHGWTMSEDAKLEACMAAIQSRLEQRSGRLERRLAEFGLDLERTHAKLGNVFNEFDGLSHSQVPTAQPHHNPQPTAAHPALRLTPNPHLTPDQFMEHRVYDDDRPMPSACVSARDDAAADDGAAGGAAGGSAGDAGAMGLSDAATDAEKEAALVLEYSALVAMGMQTMAAFPLDEPEEDTGGGSSDDHGGGGLYTTSAGAAGGELSYPEIPLPFVIGTPEFLADDMCGLFAEDEAHDPLVLTLTLTLTLTLALTLSLTLTLTLTLTRRMTHAAARPPRP